MILSRVKHRLSSRPGTWKGMIWTGRTGTGGRRVCTDCWMMIGWQDEFIRSARDELPNGQLKCQTTFIALTFMNQERIVARYSILETRLDMRTDSPRLPTTPHDPHDPPRYLSPGTSVTSPDRPAYSAYESHPTSWRPAGINHQPSTHRLYRYLFLK